MLLVFFCRMPPQAGLVIARDARAQKTVVSLSVVMNAIPFSVLLNIAQRNRVHVTAGTQSNILLCALLKALLLFIGQPNPVPFPHRHQCPPHLSRAKTNCCGIAENTYCLWTDWARRRVERQTDSMTTTALIAHSTKEPDGRTTERKKETEKENCSAKASETVGAH